MLKIFPAFEDKNIQIKHDTLVSFSLFLFVQTVFTGYSTINIGTDKTVFFSTTLTSLLIPLLIIIFARKNYRLVSILFVTVVWLTSTAALFFFDSDNSGLAYLMADLFIKSALASLTIRWYAGIFFGLATIAVGFLDQIMEENHILNFLEIVPIPPMAYLIGYSIMLGTLGIIATANAFSFEKIFLAYQTESKRREKAENLLLLQNRDLDMKVKERTVEIETLNEELKTVNIHLHQTNDEIILKNEVLSSTLEKLQLTQEQLIQSEKMASLGVLASGIAHEINNPLNFIASGIFSLENYLNEEFDGKDANLERILNVLKTGLDRSSSIVTSLNRYSRKDSAQYTKCNIFAIIDSCLLMLQNQIKHRIEIKKNYENEDFEVICNESKIHQAFLNIFANAVQAINDKGIIEIRTKCEKSKLCIWISDTGSGIEKENLGKIFDPFFTTKEPGKGTGLGLSITFKILKEHNAAIEYQSEPGQGTTVLIKLPVSAKSIEN